MILETTRLILRPWKESDAESLYEHAKNPLVGPAAGWPVHTSTQNSREIIRGVLSADETYAVTLKGDDAAIGSVGLLIGDNSNLNIPTDEGEIGYWIGQPFWGHGIIPEAVRELMRYAFDVLKLTTLWCGYFDENKKSKRAAEKCGFKYHHTEYEKEWPLINTTKTQHVTRITKDEYQRDLIVNLEKIHTTPMGEERIKRNLDLQTIDIVAWCKDAVQNADIIFGLGKNWYAYKDSAAITISTRSFTIITAHKINPKVRVLRESDYECLPEFLYHSIYIPKGEEWPSREIINDPEIIVYIKEFGSKKGDLGVVAEQNRQIIGAAWTRIIPAYGHVDEDTPELVISLLPEFRGYGIGTRLMKKLFEVLRENGYKQTSLSVQKDNPAVRFYQRLGYEMTGERPDHAGHEDYLMIKYLTENKTPTKKGVVSTLM